MTHTPRVSVVMCVVDPHPEHFPLAVRSVLAQTEPDLELLVIEEPSSREAADFLPRDPRIRHHRHDRRTSLVEQRNRGTDLARAPLIAIMDADDVCHPQRVAVQAAFLDEHPAIDVLSGSIRVIDDGGAVIGFRSYPIEHEAIERALPRYNPICQPSVMGRRDAFVHSGGYRYGRYPATEDYELWSRMVLGGRRFHNLPTPLLDYRVHPAGAKSSKLLGTLRGTIEIKEMHWTHRLGVRGRARLLGERALLHVPPAITLALFKRLTYRSQLRSDAPGHP